jgi:sugar/nucleoside kinase (ribokinase family)
MQQAHRTTIAARDDIRIAIIAPDGRDAMLQHAAQLAAAGIPFVFDPGQGLPMFDGADLKRFVGQASWVAVNDYEARMLCERTGETLETLSRSQLRAVVVTLGADGCDIWREGARTHVPGVAATEVVDPTGCGDAFRGALLSVSSALESALRRAGTGSAHSRSPAAAGRTTSSTMPRSACHPERLRAEPQLSQPAHACCIAPSFCCCGACSPSSVSRSRWSASSCLVCRRCHF